MRAPLLFGHDRRAGRIGLDTEPDGTKRLPAAGNQGGFRLSDQRTPRQRRGRLGLPHIHADPAADHGDVCMTASGAGTAFKTAITVRRIDRAVLDSRSLGGPVADADGPSVLRSDRDIDSDQHLVHVNIRLELIDGSLRARSHGPEMNDVLRIFGIGKTRRASRQHDPRSRRRPTRAEQHTRIIPRATTSSFANQRTVLLQCSVSEILYTPDGKKQTICRSRAKTMARWMASVESCSPCGSAENGAAVTSTKPRAANAWLPSSFGASAFDGAPAASTVAIASAAAADAIARVDDSVSLMVSMPLQVSPCRGQES